VAPHDYTTNKNYRSKGDEKLPFHDVDFAERAKPNATTERLATEFATHVGNLKLIAGRLQ
jgi:hypothetical protein